MQNNEQRDKMHSVSVAKATLKLILKGKSWYTGIGIGIDDATGEPCIQLNVLSDVDESVIPAAVDGVPVKIVKMAGPFRPRTEDRAKQ